MELILAIQLTQLTAARINCRKRREFPLSKQCYLGVTRTSFRPG